MAVSDYIRPEFLRKGDKVAIVEPSYTKSPDELLRALDVIRSWGYEPVPGINAGNVSGFTDDGVSHYSAPAEERASELAWALDSDEFKAIICTRGGYGAIHLLDFIPSRAFRAHPKWLVGFSDITTLHAASLSAGVMSIHGNMCVNIGKEGGPDASCLALRDLLAGKMPEYEILPHKCNVPGSSSGMLVGGNMITAAALFGTGADMLAHKDIILFVEEVEESMHAIDRLFNMFLHHKGMGNVRGIIFGEFTDCGRDLPYEDVESMLSGYVGKLGIPVCFGFPAGHGAVNMPFIEGAEVSLEVSPSAVRLGYRW